jgi:CHASE3 domain sensor protein
MDEDIKNRLGEIEKKLDTLFSSAERTRKYFLWTLIITVIVIILPLIALVFVVPQFLSTLDISNFGL